MRSDRRAWRIRRDHRFIVGIYEELIDSIKSINGASLKLLFTGKIAAFWKAINANFLLSIIAGIGISIFSLAKIITWLLTDHPILVWSFFFGLVLASTWFVSKDIKKWDWKTILSYNHRDRYCILHNGCDTSRDTFQPVLYLPLRSDSHLCHDPAGYIG